MQKPIILVADDDREIVKLLADTLEDEGFKVLTACNGKEVLEIIQREEEISLLVLDIMMPEMNGLEVCRIIRDSFAAPILLLSAKGRELDKVVGLELGADDYMTKPFSTYELVARIKAHLRREKRSEKISVASDILSFEEIVIHKETYEVFRDNQKVGLSTREFQILVYLAENKNIVLNREQIYEAVWGNGDYGDINTVTVHIKKLRDKLDPEGQLIKTVWGAGYKFSGRKR